MVNLIQRWIRNQAILLNQGTFFDFQKRAGEASPPDNLVLSLCLFIAFTVMYFVWSSIRSTFAICLHFMKIFQA